MRSDRARRAAGLALLAILGSTGCQRPVAKEGATGKGGIVAPFVPRGDTLLKPPDILSETEPGFRDLVFLASSEPTKGGGEPRLLVRAKGLHRGKPVEFGYVLAPDDGWKALDDARIPIKAYQGAGLFVSTGPESDAFLTAVADAYGTKGAPKTMAKAVPVTAISLEGDPRALDRGLVKLKLFLNENDDAKYAEVFLNLDLPHARLTLSEKDPEYRANIVKALGGASGGEGRR